MKVFIQERGTGNFLTLGGEWSTSWEKARDFGRAMPALDFCKANTLLQVEVVLVFEDGCLSVRLDPSQLQKRVPPIPNQDYRPGAQLLFALVLSRGWQWWVETEGAFGGLPCLG
jgi:hypothetical protein